MMNKEHDILKNTPFFVYNKDIRNKYETNSLLFPDEYMMFHSAENTRMISKFYDNFSPL
jgi:hypothetical protein